MPITSLYASFLAILFVVLSVRTLRMRRRLGIAVGDGGSQALLRAVRVHSNFAEYVPLGLLLTGFTESTGANAWLVHLLALCLLAGRAAHAYGVSQLAENYAFRVAGMALTFTTLLGGSAYLLLHAARAGL
jgi:uncharacterized membrane protein YecN with MAPEG domain